MDSLDSLETEKGEHNGHPMIMKDGVRMETIPVAIQTRD